MADQLLESYEAVPYESAPMAPTHPLSLATIAALHGMTPPPADGARILELGCATGGNLISMAVSLPSSGCLGIDLSPRQIEHARAAVRTLGLGNVTFEALSIADLDESFGTFDYIVCHGVFSWVPRDVQEAILRVCSRNLTPNGIAYVSYNTYPGWRVRELVRDMMLFHDDPTLGPRERANAGCRFVEFVADSAPTTEEMYRTLLKDELRSVEPARSSYFVHEQLESVNEPLYFTEFARRAAAAGLQYLAEARLRPPNAGLSGEAYARLQGWAKDRVRLEQYVDFAVNRTFRRTLLCHDGIQIEPEPSADVVRRLLVSGFCEPLSAASDQHGATEAFRSAKGQTLRTNHPLARAALRELYDARPRALSFDELGARVRTRLAPMQAQIAPLLVDDGALAELLLQCARSQFVELNVVPPPCVATISDQPVASPLARMQAATASPSIASLRHHGVELPRFDRFVLSHLDGTRDRRALVQLARHAVDRGELASDGEDAAATDLSDAVDRSLRRLRAAALLLS